MESFALVLSEKLEVVGLHLPHLQEGRKQGGSAPAFTLLAHTRHMLALCYVHCSDGTDCAYSVLNKFIERISQ